GWSSPGERPNARRPQAIRSFPRRAESARRHASTAAAPSRQPPSSRRQSACRSHLSSNTHVTLGRVPPLIIAIDGPSGAGKGTVARALAKRLGYRHLDAGAMYRSLSWKALQSGVPLDAEDSVAELAEHARLEVGPDEVRIDDEDVTPAIRTPAIDRAAAAAARLPRVRAALVNRQRKAGEQGRIVMEGRDIGTVVFPAADVKIYLDASPEERARRRAADPAHGIGRQAAIGDVENEMKARDLSDSTRLSSPLQKAEDAIRVDTTGLPVEEVVDRVMEIVEEARRRSAIGDRQ